jgi:hypothetical protein
MAIGMINDAMEIAYLYLGGNKKLTTEEELALLDILTALLAVNAEVAKHIYRRMRKQLDGERK